MYRTLVLPTFSSLNFLQILQLRAAPALGYSFLLRYAWIVKEHRHIEFFGQAALPPLCCTVRSSCAASRLRLSTGSWNFPSGKSLQSLLPHAVCVVVLIFFSLFVIVIRSLVDKCHSLTAYYIIYLQTAENTSTFIHLYIHVFITGAR